MDVKCRLETRTSREGKPYEVLVIQLTSTYEKLVFLDSAEKELLKLSNNTEPFVDPFNN